MGLAGDGPQLSAERKRKHLASFPAKPSVVKLQIKKSPHTPSLLLFVLGAAEQEGQCGQLPLLNSDRGGVHFSGNSGIGGRLVVIADLRGVITRGIARVF